MFPILFEIGPLTLRSFGLMAAIGFLLAYVVLKRISSRVASLPSSDVSQFLVMIMLGGAFGARFAYVAEHWSSEFSGIPLMNIFRFDRGGLMFYGGLGGAILAIVFYSVRKHLHLIALLDLSAVALPLGHAMGRIGCFLNGCCYGRTSHCPIAVSYPAGSPPWHEQVATGLIPRAASSSLPLLPAQLIESFLNLLLFAVLFFLAKRIPTSNRRPGLLAGIYLVSYAVIRAFTETLRSDPQIGRAHV